MIAGSLCPEKMVCNLMAKISYFSTLRKRRYRFFVIFSLKLLFAPDKLEEKLSNILFYT